jgi:hypothetical protein
VLGGMVKVFDELGPHAVAVSFLRRAKDRRWMVCGGKPSAIFAFEKLAPMLGKTKVAAKHCLSGRGAQANYDFGFDNKDFRK